MNCFIQLFSQDYNLDSYITKHYVSILSNERLKLQFKVDFYETFCASFYLFLEFLLEVCWK